MKTAFRIIGALLILSGIACLGGALIASTVQAIAAFGVLGWTNVSLGVWMMLVANL